MRDAMNCSHRYSVIVDSSGKGVIKCSRCGDIRQDGLQVGQKEDDIAAIVDRIKWERARGRGLQLPAWGPIA